MQEIKKSEASVKAKRRPLQKDKRVHKSAISGANINFHTGMGRGDPAFDIPGEGNNQD